MADCLETARLCLRPYRAEDLAALAALYGDGEVMRYAKLGRLNRTEALAALDGYLAFWNEHGFGMRALFERTGEGFVGECGLFRLKSGTLALRYALVRPRWGLGLAGEAVAATLDDAFRDHGLSAVRSIVEAENRGSLRVMEKLGLSVVAEDQAGEKRILVHEVGRAEWLARRA